MNPSGRGRRRRRADRPPPVGYARACDPDGTDGNPDQARVTVHRRDRLTVTVHSLDGGGRTHDFKLEGAPYLIPPSGIEMEMHKATQTKSFTPWNAGEFRFRCEIGGHEVAGMWATLVVEA